MKSLLYKIFIDNWPRKLFSIIIAIIIWLLVNHSMTTTKTFSNIPIKVINIPPGKTVDGMQPNRRLIQKIALTISGNKSMLEEVSSSDLEVIIDATGKEEEWIASITKKNLVSFNPDIDIQQAIDKISQEDVIIKLCDLITEKIPILVTLPIGKEPRGYQFLDIFPYQLYITLSGPEETIKNLKTRGLKLTFNLNNVSTDELAEIQKKQVSGQKDEISFLVPDSWKRISIPSLSTTPIKIDDPMAKELRINFLQQDLIPLNTPIPLSVFFPLKHSDKVNPNTYSLNTNDFVHDKNGIKIISQPMYAAGVSKGFLDMIKDKIQIVILASHEKENKSLLWNVQFVSPHDLENKYVSKILAEAPDGYLNKLRPEIHEEYLRNRFRSYMNKFRLFQTSKKKLHLKILMEDHTITISPSDTSPHPL